MRLPAALFLTMCGAAMLTAGCGRSPEADPVKPQVDPVLTSALADPIMLDTDLSGQNRASAAIAGGGPPIIELPLVERGGDAIAAAKSEAARLAGGVIRSAPAPRDGGPAAVQAVVPIQLARAGADIAENCAGKAEYALAWSQRLPEPLAIYPRGHLREAAGADAAGCSLRVVSFVTPVEPAAIIDFYYTRVKAAGFGAEHHLAEGAHHLGGRKGGAAYAVHARKLEDGLTAVDLVTNGG